MATNQTGYDVPSKGSDDDDSSPLAIWLTEARNAKGLSILQLAELSGLNTKAIYKIESGTTRNLREGTRKKLENALGMAVPEETAREIAEESEVIGLGNLEDFDPHNASERPIGPGIYVFYDISDRPIYVGEAQNVKARIVQHEDKFWFKRPIVESASWIKIADAKLRRQIEQLMIRFLKRNAVINKQHVERSGSLSTRRTGLNPILKWRPTVDVAASILEQGPLHIKALFASVTSAGAKCKSVRSLDSIMRLKENSARFQHVGGGIWRLNKP